MTSTYNKRKSLIIAALGQTQRMNVEQLCEVVGNSPATLRRDIIRMEEEGLVKRFWGGIQLNRQETDQRDTKLKNRISTDIQNVIGNLAAEQINENELIFIGSGTTTLAMVEHITKTDIQVVTNGIPQMEALHEKGIKVLLLGGFYKPYSRALVGLETIEMLRKYHFNKAFFGANGLDVRFNILSGDEYENEIKATVINQSGKSFLLVDNSKFRRTALYHVPYQTAKDVTLITDSLPDTIKLNSGEKGEALMIRFQELSDQL